MGKVAIVLAATLLAGCAGVKEGPAGVPSSTDVNPITGSRGGTNGK